jgi:RND family efflux transporter MFP subunit
VAYVKDVHQGDTVDVFIESLGSKRFKGAIKRFTMKVNEATRTMMTEIEVDNPTLEIVPGMYADVALKVQSQPWTLSIPTQAVSGDKNTVYVVNSNNEIEERPVTLGLETPNRYEVKSGLQEGDLVMIGNRTQVRPGQKVIPKIIESLAYE